MSIEQLRDYPKIGADDVLLTFKENVEEDKMPPKQAWKLAQHLHRIYPVLVKRYEHIIPYQGKDWSEGVAEPKIGVDIVDEEVIVEGVEEKGAKENE